MATNADRQSVPPIQLQLMTLSTLKMFILPPIIIVTVCFYY